MNWNLGTYGFINYDAIAEQSLCILDLGIERRYREDYKYDNKHRNYEGYLFQYTLDGCGILETHGIYHKLIKGKGFFINFPDDSRYYLPSLENPEQSWTFFYIHFSGPAVEPFFKRLSEIGDSIYSLELDSPPIRLFFELFELVKSQKQLERYKGSEWLYSFLVSLLRNIEFPSNTKRSYYVLAAVDWMQTHYSSPKNIEDMCRDIGVSFSHLTRQFYKEQGLTPIQYLSHLRIEHAMYLLLNTDMNVNHIAKESGFSCGNYFSKVFKKVLHVTPIDYRKLHKT